jgi:hypothetical protein
MANERFVLSQDLMILKEDSMKVWVSLGIHRRRSRHFLAYPHTHFFHLCFESLQTLRYRVSLLVPNYPFMHKSHFTGLEQGPLSLMSTTEELLDRKVAAPV